MAGIKVYGSDYTEDLLAVIRRGESVGAAAIVVGISRATAYRLLKAHHAREAARRGKK